MAYVRDWIGLTIIGFKVQGREPLEQYCSLYLSRERGGRNQIKGLPDRMVLLGMNGSSSKEFPLLRIFLQMNGRG